jgi:hypothetical protein
LLLLSAKRPEILYPHVSRFVDLLDSKNQILKWNAIVVLGNMSQVDQGRRCKRLLPRFYGLLPAGELITATNAVAALGKIAYACPGKRSEIANELMKVERYRYGTDECRNIALGKVILSLASFVDRDQPDQKIIKFVRRQAANPRPATAKKARLFLKRLTAA